GITFLLVDMTSPGVEVRPLVQANGAGHFNEVFLEEVRVPVANVVGEIGGGWAPTRVVMMAESQFIGGGGADPVTPKLIELARRVGRDSDANIRQDLARSHTRELLLKLLSDSMMSAVRRGDDPPVSGGVLKLFTAESRVLFGNLATELLGPAATADTDPDSEWAQLALINRFSVSIGGGTNEVGRNNIGERDLGLPREPRVDKDVPWREVPRG
ncbi:MAG: acyl-CoA dehydrogenase family protein, partial [Acidimicrobiales bacterium]